MGGKRVYLNASLAAWFNLCSFVSCSMCNVPVHRHWESEMRLLTIYAQTTSHLHLRFRLLGIAKKKIGSCMSLRFVQKEKGSGRDRPFFLFHRNQIMPSLLPQHSLCTNVSLHKQRCKCPSPRPIKLPVPPKLECIKTRHIATGNIGSIPRSFASLALGIAHAHAFSSSPPPQSCGPLQVFPHVVKLLFTPGFGPGRIISVALGGARGTGPSSDVGHACGQNCLPSAPHMPEALPGPFCGGRTVIEVASFVDTRSI